MKKDFKKIIAFVLCAVMALSLAACGGTQASSSAAQPASSGASASSSDSSSDIGMPDPFTECATMDDAMKITGFTFSVPESAAGLSSRIIRAADGLIEVIYSGSGDDEVRVRKGTGADDISGDYNTYDEVAQSDVGGLSVTYKGADGLVSTAIWTKGAYSYSVTASVGGKGLDRDAMAAIIAAADADAETMPGDSGIPNPFVDCATLADAEKTAGFKMTLPETVDGYTGPVIQAIESNLIQAIWTSGDNEVCIRKGTGADDISGDYNEYAETSTEDVSGVSVQLRGADGLVNVASWTAGGFSYCVRAADKGLATDVLNVLISQVK